MARSHTEKALKTLVGVMNQTKAPPAARVAAANSLLDRGWGKATQPISGDDDAPPIKFTKIELIGVRSTSKDT